MNEQVNEDPTFSEAPEPENGSKAYILTADKLIRNQQKIERRQFKYQVTDRRSQLRLSADGDAQQDRRKANRVAYAEMYSRLRQPQ